MEPTHGSSESDAGLSFHPVKRMAPPTPSTHDLHAFAGFRQREREFTSGPRLPVRVMIPQQDFVLCSYTGFEWSGMGIF